MELITENLSIRVRPLSFKLMVEKKPQVLSFKVIQATVTDVR